MKKYSKQRELILISLKKRCDHPTAEMLYLDLKKQMPELGIATIYRNLIQLLDEGEIIRIKSRLGKDRYDGNIKPHIHFECENCSEIEDIFFKEEEMKRLDNEIQNMSNMIEAKTKNATIILHGICKKCQSHENNL